MNSMTAYRRRGGRVLGLLAVLATVLLAAPASAQQPERFDETVRELFFAGFAGNEDALEQGMAICEETLEVNPDYPPALVWQAAGWQFQSGMAFAKGDWGTGMTLFDESVAQFDRAVSLAPDDVEVLIPRATALQASARYITDAPTRLALLETVAGDYSKILEVQAPYFEALSVHSRGELLGGLADALWRLERRDEAKVYLNRMIAELPESPYALMAERQLGEPDANAQLTCLGCHKY